MLRGKIVAIKRQNGVIIKILLENSGIPVSYPRHSLAATSSKSNNQETTGKRGDNSEERQKTKNPAEAGFKIGRRERIRTSDPLVPNQLRYQAALLAEILLFDFLVKSICGARGGT